MPRDPVRLPRRDFLRAASAAAAAACGAVAHATQADGEDAGYVDAHAHVWTDDVANYPLAGSFTTDNLVPRTFPPERLLETAEKNGVRRVVLIQHQVYHGTDNRYLLDTMRRFPGRFSAVAYLDAGGPDAVREIDRLKAAGVRGLRICAGDGGIPRWSDSENMKALWKRGAETGVALCPQIEPDYLPEVDRMCRDFPDTTVVVDHFAKIGTDGTVRAGDLDRLAGLSRHKRVHLKLSAFYGIGDRRPPYDEVVPLVRRVYNAFGPERLMWASDCPYQLFGENTYEASIDLVREGIDFFSEADRQWVLRKTAERVFFG